MPSRSDAIDPTNRLTNHIRASKSGAAASLTIERMETSLKSSVAAMPPIVIRAQMTRGAIASACAGGKTEKRIISGKAKTKTLLFLATTAANFSRYFCTKFFYYITLLALLEKDFPPLAKELCLEFQQV